jgi:hypothetical protein
MTKKKLTRHPTLNQFKPGRGYSLADWDEVSDNPEWTEEELRTAKPFAKVHPELAASIKRTRTKSPRR